MGATGRPEGRLSSAGARGAGPKTEEEAALLLPGARPGARREGAVAGRSQPGEAPRAPGRPLGVPSASPDLPARLPGTQERERGHGVGAYPRPPAGRGRGRPRPHRAAHRPQSHRSARCAQSRGVSSLGTAARDAVHQHGRSRAARHPFP